MSASVSTFFSVKMVLSGEPQKVKDMQEEKTYWRPVTKCCWHAFYFRGGKLISLCRHKTVDPDEEKKVTRPPVFYRCASCNQIESNYYRSFPTTKGWEALIEEAR